MLDPRPAPPPGCDEAPPLLAVERLSVFYPVPGKKLFSRTFPQVHAVEDVSFALDRGRTGGR